MSWAALLIWLALHPWPGPELALRLEPYAGVGRVELVLSSAAVQLACEAHGIDPVVAVAVQCEESRFASDRIGRDGERGTMQVLCGPGGRWCSRYLRPVPTWVRHELLQLIPVSAWEGCRRLAAWRAASGKDYVCHYNEGTTCSDKGRAYRERVLQWIRRGWRRVAQEGLPPGA